MFVIYRICGGSESFINTLFSSDYEVFGAFFLWKKGNDESKNEKMTIEIQLTYLWW